MAILSNINGKFRVDSAGAVYFGTSAGTNGLILKSVGTGGSPVWVDPNTVGTGPWLPLAGGTLTGPLIGTTASFNSGATNVVATFTSTDGVAGIALVDNSGNVELSASGNTFRVQPAGGTAALTVGSTSSTFTGGLNVGTYIRTANANTEYNHIQRTSAGYGLYVQQRGTGSIAQFSFGTGSAGSAGTNVLDVTRVGITINGAISLGGIITANAFRTFSTNPDYNLFTRDAAGNTMFIQAVQSNTNQPIAKFSYGSATVNAGTAVLQVSKDNSHFTNCNVGIGTTSPDVGDAGSSSTVLSVIETVGTRRGILELGDNQNADTGGIGSINFVGTYQDAGHKIMAEIRASGSGSTSGKRGSYISMFTKQDNVANIAERMRITSSGQLQLQGSTASQAKSTTQIQWAGIPGNTNASLMAQNPSGMSSASAGYHIVYGANNSSPYDAFVDVITYICGASTNVVKVSSTNLAGSPGNRSYSKTAAAVILNISGSKDYNCNVKTTFINYPH